MIGSNHTSSSGLSENGVFWISFHSSEQSILNKIHAFQQEVAESSVKVSSVRIFWNHHAISKPVEEALVDLFETLPHAGQLYFKLDYKYMSQRLLEVALPLFDEWTFHGEYRGVFMTESIAQCLQQVARRKQHKLTLMHTSISSATTDILSEALVVGKFQAFSLFRCSLPDQKAVKCLAHAFQNNHTLETVSLIDTQLQDSKLSQIVKSLQSHPCLQTLSLESNACRDQALEALHDLLIQEDCGLQYLDLSRQVRASPTTPTIFLMLIPALQCNQRLKSLDLTGNALSQEELDAIWDACGRLEHLDLSFNDIHSFPSNAVPSNTSNTPRRRSHLRTLNLFGNPIYTKPSTVDRTTQLQHILQYEHVKLCFLGEGFDKCPLYTPAIQARLDFHKVGRALLVPNVKRIPLGLWPNILESCAFQLPDASPERQATAMYQLVHGLLLGLVGGQIQ